MAIKKVYYNGSSKIIKALCKAINDLIDGGGGGGSVVSITPTIATGTKTADYSINGNAGELYAPTPPTKTSDLQNDSGFITSADLPTKTSDLQNDSGYITSSDLPTKTSDLQNDSGYITINDIDAEDVDYDNTTSGLTATDAQTAIDELALKHGTVTDTLVNIFADVLTTANLYKKTGKVLIDDAIYDISLVSNRVFATTNRCGSNTILTDSYLYNNGSMTRYLGRATTGGNTIETQSVDADATGTLIY